MALPIIQIERLGKKYPLVHHQPGGRGLRHVLQEAVRAPFRGWRRDAAPDPAGKPHQPREDFWALRQVSFSIQPGEVVGIIGRNGAGKSTLLKILSRITAPTTGRVRLEGRVASLLEVGTGFHPELTGRENIFLNGAILGMGRCEIKNKFDEIVAFAEVERFLDTPVKRYSSGMYMRLAFAVAAHLEPEILIVDEVLAVGDAAFQQKCLGKMGEVASQQGRTVLFVSHNLAAVQRLCGECKLLDGGRLVEQGAPARVVRCYLDQFRPAAPAGETICRQPNGEIALRLLDAAGAPTQSWRYGEPLRVEVRLRLRKRLWKPAVDVAFYDAERTRLFALQSDRLGASPQAVQGDWIAQFRIDNPGLTLPELQLDVGVREGAGHYFALIKDAGRITLEAASMPAGALEGCLLFPPCSVDWQPANDRANAVSKTGQRQAA